jgi:TRAP-type mannitol/chloroaromatic compound transport system substrate-binding protein
LLGEGVTLTPYSEEIMSAAEEAAFGLYDELAAQDADFKAVFDEWTPFRERVYAWNNINEGGFLRHVYAGLNA